MMTRKIAFIGRARQFSPNSEQKDTAILAAVRARIAETRACPETTLLALDIVSEDALATASDDALTDGGELRPGDGCLTMGRSAEALALTAELERRGVVVMNRPTGVSLCSQRSKLMLLMEAEGIPVPSRYAPTDGGSWWLKRGEGCAETIADVQHADSHEAVERIRREMAGRGIHAVDIRQHVEGDLLKCYAVRGTTFFRYYYPTDDGHWKFSDEQRNGAAHHYAFDEQHLRRLLDRAATAAQVDVYGGDCIIRPDGQPVLIDLNDWPSFARCREEAAKAIAEMMITRMKTWKRTNIRLT